MTTSNKKHTLKAINNNNNCNNNINRGVNELRTAKKDSSAHIVNDIKLLTPKKLRWPASHLL